MNQITIIDFNLISEIRTRIREYSKIKNSVSIRMESLLSYGNKELLSLTNNIPVLIDGNVEGHIQDGNIILYDTLLEGIQISDYKFYPYVVVEQCQEYISAVEFRKE